MAHLRLDIAVTEYATATSVPLGITGDLDIRLRFSCDTWNTGSDRVVFRKGASTDYQAFLGGVGRPILQWNDGTTSKTASATVVPSVTDGEEIWLRFTLDVDNGAGGYDVDFYTADGSLTAPTGGDFSQLGATVTGGATTSIRNLDQILDIGRSGNYAGNFYRVQVYSGIDGALVFDADPSDTSTWDCPDKLFFTEKANSATVTLQGDATLVGDCPSGNRMGGTGAIRKPPR